MLYFIAIWAFLIFVCVILGIGVLNFVKADCFQGVGDRVFAAIWLGIVILSISLLATSLVFPLSSITGVVIAIIFVFLSLLSHRTASEVVTFGKHLSPFRLLGLLAVALLVAAFTSQKITWFDTGLYHFGSIRWLSKFGAVPGLALINSKFGFTSSWFALAAPLTPKNLTSHVSAITNGFVFFIATVHCSFAIFQTIKKPKISDLFIGIYLVILISIYIATFLTGSAILISFSPDIPVNFLIGVTAWSILVISNSKKLSNCSRNLDNQSVPLILSVGTVTIKLSALPLFFVAFCFYLFKKNLGIKRFLTGFVISLIALFPMLAVGITTSGCPLYPSKLFCLNLPWLIAEEQVTKEVEDITYWGKLTDSNLSNTASFSEAFVNWLKISIEHQIMFSLIILSMIISIYLFTSKLSKNLFIWLIGINLLGMFFVILKAPLLRFGLGYFILLFVFAIASLCLRLFSRLKKISPFLQTQQELGMKHSSSKVFYLLVVSFSVAILIYGATRNLLLIPPKLPRVPVVAAQVNNINYVYPTNWTIKCWAAELPCAPSPLNPNVTLRQPSQGVAGGFVRIPQQ